MPAVVTLLTPLVNVEPGAEGIAEVRIRNTGAIVDQFACNLLGEASAWSRCDPPVLSLFPGAEDTVRVRFTPPRAATVAAGAIPFGVRITSKEDAEFSLVEEGAVQVGGFAALQLKVVPRTSQGKHRASHRVEVVNTGNAPITAAIEATDPDDILAFKIEPHTVEVPAGGMVEAKLDLVSSEGARGGVRRRGFTVTATPDAGAPGSSAEAAFEQKPRANVLIWLAVLVVAAVLVVLLRDQMAAEGATLLMR